MSPPLAHSARTPDSEPQLYVDHVNGVVAGVRERVGKMLSFFCGEETKREQLRIAALDAATFHDLGKLDPDTQDGLKRGRDAKLHWDHIDAGVAHLMCHDAEAAAWLVRAHHAPGLPAKASHFPPKGLTDTSHLRSLRGRRNDDPEKVTPGEHRTQIERTNRYLPTILAEHEASVGPHKPTKGKVKHGLRLRLLLSALVDSDHADTAYADAGWTPPKAPNTRWKERRAALDAYVAGLAKGSERDPLRRAFYEHCRDRGPDAPMVACEGPVGIGKTTAVTAHLLRRAEATGARHLFIVAPYTAILSQTAEVLHKALVLDDEGEHGDAVVAEHHHRADFSSISSRDLATLWTAPIILTTAVQFFETLASNAPSALRKLHALPGSVVFLDEAHAALPTHLWSQNWRWLNELAADWSCSFVFASGSLARFWKVEDIVGKECVDDLKELAPAELIEPMRKDEAKRVRYATLPRFGGPSQLGEAVARAPGPRLLIMNTVQSCAVMASTMRKAGHHVLHLSTALCPGDRSRVLALVQARLRSSFTDWTLVATSLMEAGIDVSFRTPFRERMAAASIIQVGGRGNRHFEWPDGVTAYDFLIEHVEGLKAHPAAALPGDVLGELFRNRRLEGAFDPAALVTEAMTREMRKRGQTGQNQLREAERASNYPEASELGHVIESDTRLVVVDRTLRDRIIKRENVSTKDLLAGSVQIWAEKAKNLELDPLLEINTLSGRNEVYWWPHDYDPAFLGYMEGALFLENVKNGAAILL